MAASPFERQVVEGDATDDRSPAKPRMADGPQQFQASPSFLDHDSPAIRLVELPAWLQSFAASVGEPSEEEAPAAPETTPSEQSVSSSSPESQDRPATSASKSSPSPTPNVGSDFITEDDLPEWLRSIVPEESPDRAFDALAFDGDEDREQITVPNVSRAWSTSKDARGVDETTSLFALVANQTPHTALPDQAVDAPPEGGRMAERAPSVGRVAGYGADRPPGDAASLGIPMPVGAESSDAEVKASFPLLPVLVAAVLLVALISAAALMFL